VVGWVDGVAGFAAAAAALELDFFLFLEGIITSEVAL
jgi:hypothetical protein